MEITLPAAEQFLSIISTLVVVQLIKKPFMKDPKVILITRVGFLASVVIQILIALFIKSKIAKVNNQKKFKYKPEASLLAVSEEPDQELEISYAEYDSNEATKMLRSVALQSVLYAVLSLKFKNSQPMIIQTFALFKNLFLSPLYRAYLFGMEIERPFEKNLLFCKANEEKVTEIVTPVEKKKKKEE